MRPATLVQERASAAPTAVYAFYDLTGVANLRRLSARRSEIPEPITTPSLQKNGGSIFTIDSDDKIAVRDGQLEASKSPPKSQATTWFYRPYKRGADAVKSLGPL